MSFEIDLAAVERHRQQYIHEGTEPPSEAEARTLRAAFGQLDASPTRKAA